jgi:opine dehydrogenase
MALKKIAIFGAGNGACTAAADLVLRGYDVTLFELPAFKQNVDPIKDRGGIEISGVIEGFAPLERVTTEIKEAVAGVDLIMIIAPSYAHRRFATICGHHLKAGQVIILNPGASGGALEFKKTLDEMGVKKEVGIAETSTLPYATRLEGPAQIRVRLQTKWLLFAAFPTQDMEKLLGDFKKLYPAAEVAQNVLETSLNNGNPVTHTAGTILNTGRIEHSKGDFYLYKEAITPSTVRVMEQVDIERLSLCELLGFKKISTPERLYISGYAITKDSYLDAYMTSPVFQSPYSSKGPTSMQSRYVVEDIAHGLVFWSSIGDEYGVPTPTMKALIHLASLINQTDYLEKGERTMKRLGLSGMSVKDLSGYLQRGERG